MEELVLVSLSETDCTQEDNTPHSLPRVLRYSCSLGLHLGVANLSKDPV
jgi:hypothetical protein